MDVGELAKAVYIVSYIFALVMISVYGFHRYLLVYLYYRYHKKVASPAGRFESLPRLTVQLPMYNEPSVARRIITKACQLDYPRDKLQIQVLDDSTDQTPDVARLAVAEARARGVDIEYIHRDNRAGYKAGALANGLRSATGEFITVFDADFAPTPDILKRSIHYFTDPAVGVVQARWDHLNRDDSLLTRSQAILLDGHFAIEHVARNRSERFMSFNGTAGTWRRAAIEDAGGWQHDTLTEDLDLSYRAQLRGWKFVFVPEVTAPAELPPVMEAFKAQQFRWTKGGVQTAMKLLPRILLSKIPWKLKVEAFFHLTCFSMHLYMFFLVLMMFPAVYMQVTAEGGHAVWTVAFHLGVFALATLSAGVFYAASQYALFGDWRVAVKYMPVLMAIGVGLCVSNTKAILEAVLGRHSEFVRTPKLGGMKKWLPGSDSGPLRPGKWIVPAVEFLLGLYMIGCVILSVVWKSPGPVIPFLVIFAFGFFYVSGMTFHAMLAGRRRKAVPDPIRAR